MTQGTQTFSYPEKSKEIQTQETIKANVDCSVNDWILYDAVANPQSEADKTDALDE